MPSLVLRLLAVPAVVVALLIAGAPNAAAGGACAG